MSDVPCIQKISFDDRGKPVTGCEVLTVRKVAGLRLTPYTSMLCVAGVDEPFPY